MYTCCYSIRRHDHQCSSIIALPFQFQVREKINKLSIIHRPVIIVATQYFPYVAHTARNRFISGSILTLGTGLYVFMSPLVVHGSGQT